MSTDTTPQNCFLLKRILEYKWIYFKNKTRGTLCNKILIFFNIKKKNINNLIFVSSYCSKFNDWSKLTFKSGFCFLRFDAWHKYARVHFMCTFFKNRNTCTGKRCTEFVYLSDKLGNTDWIPRKQILTRFLNFPDNRSIKKFDNSKRK